jgi:hypothetical protein
MRWEVESARSFHKEQTMLSKSHPLERRRILAALAIFGLSAAGIILVDSHAIVGGALCFIAILGTTWLYFDDFKVMKIANVTSWPWLGIILIGIEVAVPTYLLSATSNNENLLVAFKFDSHAPNQVNVDYVLLNLGKQSALIQTVGLLEIVGIRPTDNPIDLCDSITPMNLIIAQLGAGIMGRGAQVGDAGLRSSIYMPTELAIDGIPSQPQIPISIESTKTKIISAVFDLIANHTKDTDTLVFCPIISTLDIKNKEDPAICRGRSTQISLTGSLGSNWNTTTSTQQFRILPHTANPTCPVVK